LRGKEWRFGAGKADTDFANGPCLQARASRRKGRGLQRRKKDYPSSDEREKDKEPDTGGRRNLLALLKKRTKKIKARGGDGFVERGGILPILGKPIIFVGAPAKERAL